jgi:DNA polymerase III subunit beta
VKFRCERDVLLDALTAASKAVSTRGSSLPVLSGVRLELKGKKLTMTGSDLDLTITVETEVAGDEDGVVVIPAKLAVDIVRALPSGAVTLEAGDADARIDAARSQFSVRLIPADEFPKLSVPSGEPVELPAAELAEALRQVVQAASTDDARPILTGVLLAAEGDGLRLVATDSYRLAIRDLPGRGGLLAEGQSVLVPSRALNELGKLLDDAGDVRVLLGERDASFEVGGLRLTTRLIEGEFPNYRSLIPSAHPNRLTVGRQDLLEAVKRVRIMARDATPVRLVQRPDSLELMAVSQELGQAHEEVDAKYEGAELTVAFNPQFLSDGVDVTRGEEITLESVDALKPALIRSTESEDFLYLLMPVRVS